MGRDAVSARTLGVLVLGALALGALWLGLEGLRARPAGEARGNAPGARAETERAAESVVAPTPPAADARAEVAPAEATAGAVEDEEAEDPPTPAQPGPGQALLRVLVVARETEQPLASVSLGLTSDDEEHEWRSSTQADPARGLENDEVLTDAAGRGEFVVQADFAYTLQGEGEDGLAEPGEVALEPFRAGEEREVRLALRTAWDFAWHGRVVDGETELPIVGAEVVVLGSDSAARLEDLHALARGETGAGGHVVLRLPSWEHLSFCAAAPGYSRGGARVMEEQSSSDAAGVATLFRAAALDARVLGADGRPAADIDVRLSTGAYELVYDLGPLEEVEWRAKTDAAGSCTFAELPAHARLQVELLRGGRALQRPGDLTGELELQPGERRHVEWRLQAGCTLSGVVRDPEGRPLADVPLELTKLRGTALWMSGLEEGAYTTPDGSSSVGDAVARARSDAAGGFSIDDVWPGVWMLSPSPEAEGLPRAGLCFEIEAGQSAKTVALELERGLTIEGRVLDPDGTPIEIGVSCRRNDRKYAAFWEADMSEGDGTFSLGPVLRGEYVVKSGTGEALWAPAEELLARAGDRDVTLRMRWGGTLAGEVVDAESGEPVEAAVGLGRGYPFQPGGNRESFGFERLLPGTYDLVARTADGRIGVLSATVRAREHSDALQIPVRRGAKLAVHTQASEATVYRIEVEWQGILVENAWGDPEDLVVPPGPVVVRWMRVDRKGNEAVEHEESRVVHSAEEALVIEHRIE